MTLETVEGFLGVDYDTLREIFIVTFDDGKTNIEEIVRVLKEGGFRVKGRPKLVQ